MDKQPRRNFLKQLGTAGATAALTARNLASAQPNPMESCSDFATAVIPLESWSFALDPSGVGEAQGWFKPANDRPSARAEVTVPHTWQISADTADYMGVGWYWTEFEAPWHWAGLWVRIEFE